MHGINDTSIDTGNVRRSLFVLVPQHSVTPLQVVAGGNQGTYESVVRVTVSVVSLHVSFETLQYILMCTIKTLFINTILYMLISLLLKMYQPCLRRAPTETDSIPSGQSTGPAIVISYYVTI